MTIASRPSVGRDRRGYKPDLGLRKIRIFLQKGLDRRFSDLPVGSGDRSQGWIERFAKPISVVRNMISEALFCGLAEQGLQGREQRPRDGALVTPRGHNRLYVT